MFEFWNPEFFQGNYKKKHYFEGWYFKCSTKDKKRCISFIPGIALEHSKKAFIQVIDSVGISDIIYFPGNESMFSKKKFDLKIGANCFNLDHIDIDFSKENLKICGKIVFSNHVPFPKKGLFRGIMGPYTYVPFMECYHDVISIRHRLKGSLKINDELVDLTDGIGYIEKDWGTSFPSRWIWIQGNQFENSDASFFLSIAKIPWIGKSFEGLIAFIMVNGSYYPITTYNGGQIVNLEIKNNKLLIKIANKKFNITAETDLSSGMELLAPSKGNMNTKIKEILCNQTKVSLKKGNNEIFNGICKTTGTEIHGDFR